MKSGPHGPIFRLGLIDPLKIESRFVTALKRLWTGEFVVVVCLAVVISVEGLKKKGSLDFGLEKSVVVASRFAQALEMRKTALIFPGHRNVREFKSCVQYRGKSENFIIGIT